MAAFPRTKRQHDFIPLADRSPGALCTKESSRSGLAYSILNRDVVSAALSDGGRPDSLIDKYLTKTRLTRGDVPAETGRFSYVHERLSAEPQERPANSVRDDSSRSNAEPATATLKPRTHSFREERRRWTDTDVRRSPIQRWLRGFRITLRPRTRHRCVTVTEPGVYVFNRTVSLPVQSPCMLANIFQGRIRDAPGASGSGDGSVARGFSNSVRVEYLTPARWRSPDRCGSRALASGNGPLDPNRFRDLQFRNHGSLYTRSRAEERTRYQWTFRQTSSFKRATVTTIADLRNDGEPPRMPEQGTTTVYSPLPRQPG